MTVQQKNQEIQNAISQEIAKQLALQLLAMIFAIIPGFVWIGWGGSKRVDQTEEGDFDALSLEDIKSWAGACTEAHTAATEHGPG